MLSVIMLGVKNNLCMLSVIVLMVFLLNVFMLNVITLIVVIPKSRLRKGACLSH
jgi:hypothetical protein